MELPKTQADASPGSLDSTERLDLSDTYSPAQRTAAASRELPPGTPLAGGRFRIVRVLGEGGMGRVYEAHDEAYGCEVALKTLRAHDAHLLFGLKNEFRSLAFVAHPNLVELHELICEDELWFMTMELVEGENLATWLSRHVPARERCDPEYESSLRDIFLQIARGVDALHAAGKLHRDLKPSNIMLDRSGRVVILDFGLVTETRRGSGNDEPGVVAGTPVYLAPEQAAGQPASRASDWYAFGVMLYEALCGRLPFSGEALGVMAAQRGVFARRAGLRRVERLAARLDREQVRHASALAEIARGGAAQLERDAERAVGHLRQACRLFEADRQQLWAACARLRLGRLLGGSAGAVEVERALAQMRASGVAEPDRFVAVYAGGYLD